jgi:uncharacterized protein (UPF0332 family)
MPSDVGTFYSRAFDRRLKSDYGEVVGLGEDEIAADLAKAGEFIAYVQSLLGSIGDGAQ